MNGPRHYREAERLLVEVTTGGDVEVTLAMAKIAAAQVHATLALAAAEAESSIAVLAAAPGGRPIDAARAWSEAIT